MTRLHRNLAIAAAALGCAAAVADVRPGADAAELAREVETERDHISAPELAERLKSGDKHLAVYDLRSEKEFDEIHIIGASRVTLAALASMTLPRDSDIVLYSEGGTHAAQGWALLRMRGYRRVFFLREGIYEWVSRVLDPRLATDATAEERAEFERASELSRYFGGTPVAGVPRGEVPTGYWTDPAHRDAKPSAAPAETRRVRRRGC